MLSGLILTAFLMGLGGVPHCAAMCGAACAAFLPKGVPWVTLLGRCIGYALLGAVAALGFGMAAQLGRQVGFLKPLWILVQAAVLLLGLWMLWRGATPAQLDSLGRDAYQAMRRKIDKSSAFRVGGPARMAWPFVAGMAWALLPCGLLYAALTVAALAPTPSGGALVMLAFALPGAMGVWSAPAVLRRMARLARLGGAGAQTSPPIPNNTIAAPDIVPVLWLRAPASRAEAAPPPASPAASSPAPTLIDPRWAIRLSGLLLSLMSVWALYHQVMDQWRAWCA